MSKSPIGIVLILLIMSMFGCMRINRAPAEYRLMPDQDATTVRVEVWCISGDPWEGDVEGVGLRGRTGTGVIINDRNVITANHVIKCDNAQASVRITLANGERYRMNVTREDPGHDMALMELSTAERFSHARPPVIGQIIPGSAVCSSVASPRREHHCGVILGIGVYPGNVHHTASTMSGNSGGPAYSADGKLIGIVTSKASDGLSGWFSAIPDGWMP